PHALLVRLYADLGGSVPGLVVGSHSQHCSPDFQLWTAADSGAAQIVPSSTIRSQHNATARFMASLWFPEPASFAHRRWRGFWRSFERPSLAGLCGRA